MNSMTVAVTACAFSLAFASTADAQDYRAAQTRAWAIGNEREIRAGTYLKLVAELSGWRIWRETYARGASCSAVKPAEGVRQPHPFSSISFYGTFPAVLITDEAAGLVTEPHRQWQIIGRWSNAQTQEYRAVGERFYSSRPDALAAPDAWEPFFAFDGQRVEIHVVSHQYPAIHEGRSEQTAVIDLAGLANALAAVKACNALAYE